MFSNHSLLLPGNYQDIILIWSETVVTSSAFKKRRGSCLVKMYVQLLIKFILISAKNVFQFHLFYLENARDWEMAPWTSSQKYVHLREGGRERQGERQGETGREGEGEGRDNNVMTKLLTLWNSFDCVALWQHFGILKNILVSCSVMMNFLDTMVCVLHHDKPLTCFWLPYKVCNVIYLFIS